MSHRRNERVLLETARYRIEGTLSLPADGYRSRLSDFLNSSEREFIAVTDVTLLALDELGRPGDPISRDFVAIARSHIVLATTVS